MKKNDPLSSQINSTKFNDKSSESTIATTTPNVNSTSRGNSSSLSTTTVITTNSGGGGGGVGGDVGGAVGGRGSAAVGRQNVIYNQTISALIRGLHDTGIRDINTLHLPLVEEVDEETATIDTLTQQQTLLKPSNTLNHSISSPNSVCSTPRIKSEMTPHASLPRLIINIETADGENVNGSGGGVGVGVRTAGSYTSRSLSPDDLESHKQNGPNDLIHSPVRRFSQFNFALRRFSHVNNPLVHGKVTF